MRLWEEQKDVVAEVRQAIRMGYRSILVVAPTGAGKTVIGAHILHACNEKKNPSIFFAHRRELVYQTRDKLDKFGAVHGIIMADEPSETYLGTQIASIDTFRSRYMRRKQDREMMGVWKREPVGAKICMIDEAHRSCSPTYTTVIDHYRKEAIVIGLTATPIRGDGKGLGRHCIRRDQISVQNRN